jgi:hypothetical protein
MKRGNFSIQFTMLALALLTSCSSTRKEKPVKEPAKTQKIKKNEIGEVSVSQKKPSIQDEEGFFDDDLIQLKTDINKWKLIDDQNGIRTFERVISSNGLVAFRGEVIIHAPLKKVATVLVHQPHQKEWVHAYVKGSNVAEINDLEYIQYSETKVPWPFENRDFVFRAKARTDVNPATMLISMKSEENLSAPVRDGVVRGEIVNSYYYLKERAGGRHTKLVVEMEVDPKGEIPLWLVNLSQKGWPHNTLFGIRKMSIKKDITVLDRLEKLFDIGAVKKEKIK